MPQSILPVAFDLTASQLTASQLTAKSQASKPLLSKDDALPRESFADHLQRTQERANPIKQKDSSRKTVHERTQSAGNNQTQDTKSQTNSKTHLQKANSSKAYEADEKLITSRGDVSGKISGAVETVDSDELLSSEKEMDSVEDTTDTAIADEGQVIAVNVTSQQHLLDTKETSASDFFLMPAASQESTEISVMSDVQVEGDMLQLSEPTLGIDETNLGNSELATQNNTTPIDSATLTDVLLSQKAMTLQNALVASETPALDAPILLAAEATLQSVPVITLQSSVNGNSNASINTSTSVLDAFNLPTNTGTDLSLDELVPLSESESMEIESPVEDLGDLLFKGDEKNNKTEQFKLLMGQSIAKEQVIPLEKPAANPLVQGSLQSVANELAPASRLFVPQAQLGMSAGHPQWGKAMGEKILWMANQQLSSADIRLDPPELGSLQVKVTVQQDQASITFISPHPQVRELLDQQAVRLRELFADQGLNLGHVDIADRHQQSSGDSQGNSQSSRHFASEESSEELMQTSVSSLYLVDLHA